MSTETQPVWQIAPSNDARAQRTYYVSDERLRAFGQLSYAQRLQWVEQCSHFVRMAQAAKAQALTAQRVGT
jgi:hypothetical protein